MPTVSSPVLSWHNLIMCPVPAGAVRSGLADHAVRERPHPPPMFPLPFSHISEQAPRPTLLKVAGGRCANDYVHRRRASPFPDSPGFPEWMWRNQCMAEFFEWCKARQPKPPQLFGIDCYR